LRYALSTMVYPTDSLLFNTMIPKIKSTHSKELVSLMTENLTAHLLLVSEKMDMDAYLARWKMEDLQIIVTTLNFMRMGINGMYSH
jgi:predicted transcriptional regulator